MTAAKNGKVGIQVLGWQAFVQVKPAAEAAFQSGVQALAKQYQRL